MSAVSTKLTLDPSDFNKGILSAASAMNSFTKETSEAIDDISDGFLNIEDSASKITEGTEVSSQKQGQSWSRVGKAISAVALISNGLFKSMVDASPSLSAAFAEVNFMFQEMFMVLGESLAPIIEDTIVPAMEALTDFVIGLSPEIQTLIAGGIGLTAMFTAASSVLSIFGVSLTALLGPVGLVIIGIAALALAYHTNFGGMKDTTDEVFGYIISSIENFVESHGEQFQRIFDQFNEFWVIIQPFVEAVAKLFIENFAAKIKFAFDIVIIAVDFLLDVIEGFMDILIGLFTGDTERMMEGFSTIITGYLDLVGDTLEKSFEFFQEIFSNFSDFVVNFVEDVFGEDTSIKVQENMDFVIDIFDTAFITIMDLFDTFSEGVSGLLDTLFKGETEESLGIFVDMVTKSLNVIIGYINDTLIGNLNAILDEVASIVDLIPKVDKPSWSIPEIPTFHSGGIVPGAIGQEVMVKALGGEVISNPMRGQTPNTFNNSRSINVTNRININNPQIPNKRAERRLLQDIDKGLRKNLNNYLSK